MTDRNPHYHGVRGNGYGEVLESWILNFRAAWNAGAVEKVYIVLGTLFTILVVLSLLGLL